MASQSKGTTKDDIIRALLNASFSRSAGSTSMSDVASYLNMKKASLYNHISGRDQLVSQTVDSCADYIRQITFIPGDYESVCKKYSAQTVLKGITERYFKIHEKDPLFQIYTFIESQKYFDEKAASIVLEEEKVLEQQISLVFTSLADENKLSLTSQKIPGAVRWFCMGLRTLLSDWLLERKKIVMENPVSGEGELFALPQDEGISQKVDSFVAEFISIIQSS